MKQLVMYLLVVLMVCSGQVQARPKIGLVLGGGGAAGVAHVGVLKVLEENHIPIDVVAGNSMGAIVGSLYASGMPVADIEKTVNTLDWPKLFRDDPDYQLKSFGQKQQSADFFNAFEVGIGKDGVKLPSGLISGQSLMFELRRLLAPVEHIQDFDRLPIPFRAVATDIRTGETVVLKQGNLATAVRASMSIPGLFAPVTIGNHLLVDGLVTNNLPVDVARQMGADILIVSSIPPSTDQKFDSVLDISVRSMELLMRKSSEEQIATLKPQDILIYPQIGDISGLAFGRVKETIPLGVKGARVQQAALQRLAQQLGTDVRPETRKPPPTNAPVKIVAVQLENDSALSDAVVRRRLGIDAGTVLTEQSLQAALNRVYSLGYFGLVDYQLVARADGNYDLQIIARQSTEGEKRLGAGFSLSDDFNGDTQYQAGLQYVRKGLTNKGTELRAQGIIGERLLAQAQLHHPLQDDKGTFIEPRTWYSERDIGVWQNEQQVAEVRSREVGAQVDAGREVSANAEVRVGVFERHVKPTVKTGSLAGTELQATRRNEGGIAVQYQRDTLDSVHFPTQGGRFSVAFSRGMKLLGSSTNFSRVEADAEQVWSIADQHRVIASGYAVANTDNDKGVFASNVQSLNQNGRLAYATNERRAGNYQVGGSLAYMHKVTEIPQVAKVHAGVAIGAQQEWQTSDAVEAGNLRQSAAVFIGAETRAGPAFAGVRKKEGGDNELYFTFGRDF